MVNSWLIGIDDTDNKESRGTGYLSRILGHLIEDEKTGLVHSISRHQLFFDNRIPYTSQNSSACLLVESGDYPHLSQLCRDFMSHNCAPGSDGGLAIASLNQIPKEIISWGKAAKNTVLTQADAWILAKKHNLYLEGFTGNKDGVIGALAAVGLRKSGNDGRCIWLRGKEIREIQGIYTAKNLKEICAVNRIMTTDAIEAFEDERINTGDWLRPAIKNNQIIVYIERSNTNEYEWNVKPKSSLKELTD
ncbi:MAG: hypothetical protein K9G61_11125 [Bacteroidales bacterium]|nr:hypothetical protein [Bacteroidales bacterium]